MTAPTRRAETAMVLLRRIDSDGIAHCILRNHEEIPLDPGRDIDLIANDADLDRVADILRGVASDFDWPELFRCSEHHEGTSFYFVDSRPGVVEQLEIHFTRIRWASVDVQTGSEIMAGRSRTASGLWVAADSDVATQRVVQYGLAGQLDDMKAEYWEWLRQFTADNPDVVRRSLGRVGMKRESVDRVLEAVSRSDRGTVGDELRRFRLRFLFGGISRRPRQSVDFARHVFNKARPMRSARQCGVLAQGASDPLVHSVKPMFLDVFEWDGSGGQLATAVGVLARAGLVSVAADNDIHPSMSDVALDLRDASDPEGRRLIAQDFGSHHVAG